MSQHETIVCNICGDSEFADFRGREKVRCSRCGSLERHRMCLEVYKQEMPADPQQKVLHFAPEHCFSNFFSQFHYFAADGNPSIYEWTTPIRLYLPDDLCIFADESFDYVIHNHVLEHLAGDWRDHLLEFLRILKPGGKMIYSVPGPIRAGSLTEDGGEHFESDTERTQRFGQRDHYKRFGADLFDYLRRVSDFNESATISREVLTKHRAGERVMVARKA